MHVLGIDVPHRLMTNWRRWLAPDPQPFFLCPAEEEPPGSTDGEMTPELRDTFRTYAIERELKVVWLSERSFSCLQKATRARLVRSQVAHRRGAVPTVEGWKDVLDAHVLRSQADGHRFVWWPSMLVDDDGTIPRRVVSDRRLTSRHRDVPAATWLRCAELLPQARARRYLSGWKRTELLHDRARSERRIESGGCVGGTRTV
jgi:hypothetical protein